MWTDRMGQQKGHGVRDAISEMKMTRSFTLFVLAFGEWTTGLKIGRSLPYSYKCNDDTTCASP